MAEPIAHNSPPAPDGGRPRSQLLVQLDLYNAYERLNGFRVDDDAPLGDEKAVAVSESGQESGENKEKQPAAAARAKAGNGVSPLMSTEEIKATIDGLRRQITRRRRNRSQQEFGIEERKITELQTLEDEIGSPRARARYDQLNPQNELLTIQPSPHDRWLDPKHRAGLVTAWLVEEFGPDSLLPSPDSLRFWAPRGLDPELVKLLGGFQRPATPGSAKSATGPEPRTAQNTPAPARAATTATAAGIPGESEILNVAELNALADLPQSAPIGSETA